MCEARPTEKQLMVCGDDPCACLVVAWNFQGRLCAAAYVHNSQAYTVSEKVAAEAWRDARKRKGKQDCTEAADPNSISGHEWCYVEVALHLCTAVHACTLRCGAAAK